MKRIALALILCSLSTFAFAQDSLNITRVWQSEAWTQSREFARSGDLLYVAETHSLKILDISDRENPVLIGESEQMDDVVFGIALRWDQACLYGSALDFFDVSDPTMPRHVGHFRPTASTNDAIYYNDETLLVAGSLRLTVYDVSDPSDLETVGSGLGLAATLSSMTLYGNFLYLRASGGISIIDLSDLTLPEIVGTIAVSFGAAAEVIDDTLYVTDDSHLKLYDLTNPTAPVRIGQVSIFNAYDAKISKSGNIVGVASFSYPLVFFISMADPAHPEILSYHFLEFGSSDLECVGDILFLARYCCGISLVNIANPESPQLLGAYVPGQSSSWHYFEGDYLFNSSFSVLDVSEPISPVQVSTVPVEGIFLDATMDHGYMVVSLDSTNTMPIYSIADPEQPVLISGIHYEDYQSMGTIALDFPYLYVNDNWTSSDSMQVFDLSDPMQPIPSFTFPLPIPRDYYTRVELSNEYMLIFRELGGSSFYLYRREDPDPPVLLDSLDIDSPGYLHSALIKDDLIYISIASQGVYVVDIADPMNMAVVSLFDSASSAYGCDVQENIAAVAESRDGIRLFDLTDILHPREIGFYNTAGDARQITIRGDKVFVSNTTNLAVYDISAALPVQERTPSELPTTVSLAAYPNPFNPSTTIAFELTERAMITLDVFDVTGRLVSTLIHEPLSAGSYRQNFDAHGLPSGAYFARLATPNVTKTTRITLVR